MINEKINILLVEDNQADAILIKRQISKIVAFPKVLQVTTFQEFRDALNLFNPDVLLCDYQLNEFTGLEVLEYVQKSKKYTPFIFITGTINDEELAAHSILTGATGYILKKNINQLHQKLLPHFTKIIEDREAFKITSEHKAFFEEMQVYLKTINEGNKIMKAEYLQMKEALERIKALNK